MKRLKWINIFLHLQLMLAIVGRRALSRLEECEGEKEEINGKKGAYTTDDDIKPITKSLVLADVTEMLIIDGDVKTSNEFTECHHATDYLILPDGDKKCFTEKFCKVLVPPGRNISQVKHECSSAFLSAVRRRCNTTWTTASLWPPVVCVLVNFDVFNAKLNYSFVNINRQSGRTYVKEINTEQSQASDNTTAIVATSVGFVLLLLFVITLLLYTRKLRQRQRPIDIPPYAVHVSVRRRSHGTDYMFNEQGQRNQYNMVVPGVAVMEAEYLQPANESPYCEIRDANNVQPTMDSRRGIEYEMANSRHPYQNGMVGSDHVMRNSTEALCNSVVDLRPAPSTDNIRHSGYVEMSSNSALDSSTSLLDAGPTHTPYGEIIGTMNQSGSLERFNPCEDQYKSVRKPGRNRKRSNSA